MASISALTLVAVLFASLSIWTVHADTVAFLDGASKPYLKESIPSQLSADGYSVLQSVLSNEAPPSRVSEDVATEVDHFLIPDVFHRPVATWNVVVLGATPAELFANKETTDADIPAVKVAEVVGSSPVSMHRSPTKRVFQSCDISCLAESLGQGAERLGGSYQRQGSADLTGVLSLAQCSAEGLQLEQGALSFWAAELGALWRDLLTTPRVSNRPVHYDSALIGLFLVRQKYGIDSNAFRFSTCYTAATLKRLHQIVGEEVNGQLLMSILTQKHIETNVVVEEAMASHGRNLLEIKWYGDNDPNYTALEKTKRFSTNTVAYVMFLILLFSGLGSFYAMVNMDFTKDTLLYSQARVD